ncbi:MAG: class I SAM-dependent methyltransferase [Deltaproteobacteria bacterium]|nr:class I SAM-dependent methyltransferase [Deltaproteobacteria bacterium]
MAEKSASRTALGTACMRAAHQLLDAPPLILEDPLAVRLLGPGAEKHIRETAASFREKNRLHLRSHVVLRSRFAEDRLARAVSRGVGQYLVLGAGFDTFALRNPAWAAGLRLWEVDHAGTQARKRELIAAAGLSLPAAATLAAVDFERETLAQSLARHGVSKDTPAFFSWLGVTMYLGQEAIVAVLSAVASFPPGSEIVLTFAPPPGDQPSHYDQRSAGLGEPWISYFTPEEMTDLLRATGFGQVELLTPDQAKERYYASRPDDLPPPFQTNMVAAIL